MIYRTRVNLCIHKSVSSPVHEEHLPDHVDKVQYLAAEELQEVEGVLASVLLNILHDRGDPLRPLGLLHHQLGLEHALQQT